MHLIRTLAIISCIAAISVKLLGGSAANHTMPDPQLTPGAVDPSCDATVACRPGYAREHRTWRDKYGTARKYGISWTQAKDMEDDDLVPIGLCGDNAVPANHWMQPCSVWRAIGTRGLRECVAGEAYEKDKKEWTWEDKVRIACHIGDMAQAQQIIDAGQHFFLSGEWTR